MKQIMMKESEDLFLASADYENALDDWLELHHCKECDEIYDEELPEHICDECKAEKESDEADK